MNNNAMNSASVGMGITAPTVADPELQAAINRIAGRFNVLVAQRNFLNGVPLNGESSAGATPSTVTAELGVHHKENGSVGSESAMDVDAIEQIGQQTRRESPRDKDKRC